MRYYTVIVKNRKEKIIISTSDKFSFAKKKFITWTIKKSGIYLDSKKGLINCSIYSCSCGSIGEGIHTSIGNLNIINCQECKLNISISCFEFEKFHKYNPTKEEKIQIIIYKLQQD